MTHAKSTKRALLASVMALFLCFAMLLGTTYAWFTDSVTSANNIIKSGTLKIDLVHNIAPDNNVSLKTVTDHKVFDYKNWEPGYTRVETLTIVNEGTLALKYEMALYTAGEINAETGERLADVIDVYVCDGASTATNAADLTGTAWTKLGTLADVLDNSKKIVEGNLLDKDSTEASRTFTIALHMQETAGNEYQGLSLGNLAVTLLATQYTAENDSFGPDYDKDAIYADKNYTIDSTGTLAGTLADINAAQDKNVLVQLGADMEWETGGGHGSTPWVDENAVVENLIIDAQGKTITATGSGVGPIRMANGGTLTIKNAKIVDNSVSYAEDSWEFGYLEIAGNVVFENVEFVNAIAVDGESAIFKNCTFNSNKDNEYAVWVSNGDATFTGCTFAGPRGLKTHEAYGSEVGTILVDNCTFDNITKKPGMVIGTVNANTTITIKNSDFINCQAGDQGLYIYETDTDVATFNFDCRTNNEVIKVVTPDLVISTKEELFAFANDVNVNGNSYAGKLIVLGADIDLNNEEWTPVGQTGGNGAATYFQGMFDGKGYTIKNLKITDNAHDEGANYAAGFFGFIDTADAQIVNLTIDGAEVNGHHWTGVVAGYLSGKISNCTVKNATVQCTHANDNACGDKAGVIVGYINTGTATNNSAQNCTVTAGRDAGQIAGAAKTTQAYGNTAINVTVSAYDDCTGANVNNAEIGRVMG